MTERVQEIIRQLPMGVKDNNELETLSKIDRKLDLEPVTKEDLEQIELILENNKNNLAQYYWNFKERIDEEKKYFEIIENRKKEILTLIEKLREEGKELELLTSIESRINNDILTVRDLEEIMNLTETSVKMDEEYARNSLNMLVDEINRMYLVAEVELDNCKEKLASDKYTKEEKIKIFQQTSEIIEKIINNAYLENLKEQNVTSTDEQSISMYAKNELIQQLRDVLTDEEIQNLSNSISELSSDDSKDEEEEIKIEDIKEESEEIEEQDDTREIEKIEAKILENEQLIMNFLSQNKERVKVKVKTIIENSELTDDEKQNYLNRLDTELTAEQLNEIINENSLNDDCELIISVIEEQIEEFGNNEEEMFEITEENKETIIEIIKEKLEKEHETVETEEDKERIQIELNKLTTDCTIEDINEIISQNHYNDNNELVIELLDNQVKFIEQEQQNIEEEIQSDEKIIKKNNVKLCNHYTDLIIKELHDNSNLTEENKQLLSELKETTHKLSKEEILDIEKLNEVIKELDSLKINHKPEENYTLENELINRRIEEKKKNILKLEEEKQDIANKKQRINLKDNPQQLQNDLEKFQNLNNKFYNAQRNAYYTIKENIVNQLENDEEFTNLSPEEQCQKIAELIENHELRVTFKEYEKEEKLLGELVEEIYQTLNKEKEKEEKEEKPKKDWKKWGAALAGFATGVGLSFVSGPVPGLIILGSRVAQKVAKPIMIKSIENLEKNNIEKIKNGEETTQTFKDKLNNLKLKIQKALVSKEFEYFLNGVLIGYGAGKIGQSLYDKFSPPKNTPSGTGGKVGGVTPPQPPTPSIPGLKDTVDVRGIQGFVNSYGEGGTTIIEDLAKEAIIDKENNGFYHLVDRFGEDLGWYKISDIEQKAKMINDVTTAVVKHTR